MAQFAPLAPNTIRVNILVSTLLSIEILILCVESINSLHHLAIAPLN